MTKKLIWRLKEQPSSESLLRLVKDNLLTKDEAREILFSSETEEDRDKKSLESEIKFLRELVEKLAKRSEIITTIREIEVPYRRFHWHDPYTVWCNMTNTDSIGRNTTSIDLTAGSGTITYDTSNFSDIKTF